MDITKLNYFWTLNGTNKTQRFWTLNRNNKTRTIFGHKNGNNKTQRFLDTDDKQTGSSLRQI